MVPRGGRDRLAVAERQPPEDQEPEPQPACSLFLLDLANPYRYLELRGDAEISPDPDYALAARLGAKYQSDVREHDQPGDTRVVVTIRPVRVNAVNMGG